MVKEEMSQKILETSTGATRGHSISKWSNRFIWAAFIQGLAATLLTIPIVLPELKPAVAQIIASGGAGTWFLVGYVMYITVGVIGVGVTALFYYHYEVELGNRYHGFANFLAWIHFILMNFGVATATWLLMYAGYFGERAMMTASEGGLGLSVAQTHAEILSGLVNPIGAALVVTGIGILAGGLGFVVTYFKK